MDSLELIFSLIYLGDLEIARNRDPQESSS